MPNKKGGKKYKSQKKQFDDSKVTNLKDDGQSYGIVTDVLGNCRFKCTLDTGNKVLGILCGRLRKRRVWVKKNDLVLVGLRDFEESKVDIIGKYDESEYEYLKNTETCLDLLLKDKEESNIEDSINFEENHELGYEEQRLSDMSEGHDDGDDVDIEDL